MKNLFYLFLKLYIKMKEKSQKEYPSHETNLDLLFYS